METTSCADSAHALEEAERRLTEILELVEDRVDITSTGQPNLAMRISTIAKGQDKP